MHGYLELLVAAGNETARNAIGGGMTAFMSTQKAACFAAGAGRLVASVLEEVLRWWSPVIQFARQATGDTSVGGVEIAAGEMVVLW